MNIQVPVRTTTVMESGVPERQEKRKQRNVPRM
jgi:hypothetical protein